MKKAILTIAIAVMAMTAQAQIIVGGNINLQHNGGNSLTTSPDRTIAQNSATTFTFSPKVGYQMDNKWQFGVALNYSYSYSRVYGTLPIGAANNFENYVSSTYTSLGLSPYTRYNIAQMDKFTLFCEAALNFTYQPKSSSYNNNTATSTKGTYHSYNIGLTLTPGVNYKINKHLSADLYIDLAGCYYNYSAGFTEVNATTTTTATSHSFGFTANAEPQNLNQHLGIIRLGFNYHL